MEKWSAAIAPFAFGEDRQGYLGTDEAAARHKASVVSVAC